MESYIFGPAKITHNGVDLGDTKNGGSIQILATSDELVSTTYEVEQISYGVTGTVSFFSFFPTTVTDSLLLYDSGLVVIEGTEFKITLYSAKIYFPKTLSFGTLTHVPCTLTIVGGTDSEGKLFKIE